MVVVEAAYGGGGGGDGLVDYCDFQQWWRRGVVGVLTQLVVGGWGFCSFCLWWWWW